MDLSICLVPLNALVYLEPLLASIEQHTIGLSYEVIMVDNGSTDGTLEWVKEHHPEIQLIPRPTSASPAVTTRQWRWQKAISCCFSTLIPS